MYSSYKWTFVPSDQHLPIYHTSLAPCSQHSTGESSLRRWVLNRKWAIWGIAFETEGTVSARTYGKEASVSHWVSERERRDEVADGCVWSLGSGVGGWADHLLGPGRSVGLVVTQKTSSRLWTWAALHLERHHPPHFAGRFPALLPPGLFSWEAVSSLITAPGSQQFTAQPWNRPQATCGTSEWFTCSPFLYLVPFHAHGPSFQREKEGGI